MKLDLKGPRNMKKTIEDSGKYFKKWGMPICNWDNRKNLRNTWKTVDRYLIKPVRSLPVLLRFLQ